MFGLVDFRDANLSGVDLSGFDFSTTVFSGADLRGANLRASDFRGISPVYDDTFLNTQFNSATIYDSMTQFPPGFDPVGAGLTFVPEPSAIALAISASLVVLLWPRRRRID